MGPRRKNLTGQKWNRLTAVEFNFVDKGGNAHWFWQCDCGSPVKSIAANLVKRGTIKGCGCVRGGSHKESYPETPEYKTWKGMIGRCRWPNPDNRAYYFDRDIKVCARWTDHVHGFDNFLSDMGRKPTPEHSIDRIDVNGNYTPANCRWATKAQQAKNRRPRQ